VGLGIERNLAAGLARRAANFGFFRLALGIVAFLLDQPTQIEPESPPPRIRKGRSPGILNRRLAMPRDYGALSGLGTLVGSRLHGLHHGYVISPFQGFLRAMGLAAF